MWSVSPWVSTSARTSSRVLPIEASSELSSFQYPGGPASLIVTSSPSMTR